MSGEDDIQTFSGVSMHVIKIQHYGLWCSYYTQTLISKNICTIRQLDKKVLAFTFTFSITIYYLI